MCDTWIFLSMYTFCICMINAINVFNTKARPWRYHFTVLFKLNNKVLFEMHQLQIQH